MLDLFTIFSKGGIVLWCFQDAAQGLTLSVNSLIKNVILQDRGGLESFTHEALTMKYRLDNEFELVFVVAYQKFLQLSYVDKLLNDIQMEFRNRYKDDLVKNNLYFNVEGFRDIFMKRLKQSEESDKNETRKMRTFAESAKSQKSVGSMIENKKPEPTKKAAKKVKEAAATADVLKAKDPLNGVANPLAQLSPMARKINGAVQWPKKKVEELKKEAKKKEKMGRKWTDKATAVDMHSLDFSDNKLSADASAIAASVAADQQTYVSMKGQLPDLFEDEEEEEDTKNDNDSGNKPKSSFGFLGNLKSLVSSKVLKREDMEELVEKMKSHLISKNVAAEIAEKLCESVVTKLEGKVLGTFTSIASTVRQTMEDSCVQLLTPKRRINILRDALDNKNNSSPYTIVFCGVNGVGKSTNLAKICYWLLENDLKVLIAACDTFRAGAVEQLRTHCHKLNSIVSRGTDETRVQLYDKGYGKDDAGVAMGAINYARSMRFDVVLVDTAGRMQGNEHLMRSLAKLINVNTPDLVLFVGEALVGNDAVDQLLKFNQALADFSNADHPHLIDGIVLTKFDTIDDKVGAAISMTYITGQPIVFVGTGQTYSDLKNLNARSVVNSLLK